MPIADARHTSEMECIDSIPVLLIRRLLLLPNEVTACSLLVVEDAGIDAVGSKLQHIAGLAVEGAADSVKGREADGLRLARLEDGEVGGGDADAFGQFLRGHFALRQHHVNVYDNRHKL